MSLPAVWTDIQPLDPFVLLSQGRAYFRLTGLLELADFMDQVREARLPREHPTRQANYAEGANGIMPQHITGK